MRHFSVARLFKSMAMACIALTSAPLMAVDFDQSQYDVYIGDRNGDGRDDILLVAKDSIIPIHGEVLVPLAVQLSENYAIESGPGFYYDPVTLSDAEIDLSGFSLATNTVIYDYNNDGQLDLVIGQQGTSLGNIALLGGVDSSENPILVANVDEYDVLSTPPNPGSIGIAEIHVNTGILKTSDELAPIAGEFRVNESGAATYSIPIYAPPGSAGVAPQITLNYSSQNGNGLLGQGWSLGGLSSISRCRQTMATDGHARPLTWTEEDRFCIDGQRLLLETGSTYGAIGATYKTEVDRFATIISVGGSLGHPDYFLMKSKDGTTSTFGKNIDAEFYNPNNNQTYTWSISKFEDSVGNKIDFNYDKTITTQTISTIAYGSATTNHSSINFQYETRPQDKLSGYVSGFKVETLNRMTGIEVKNGTNVLRHYSINYDHINTDFSRVVKIEECSNASNTAHCRGATSFDWNYPLSGLSSGRESLFTLPTTQFSDFKPADINGDGLQDLAYVRFSGGFRDYVFGYAINDGDKLVQTEEFVFENNAFHGALVKIEVVDYNVDGRADILLYDGEFPDNPWSLYLSEPAGDGWRLNKKSDTQIPFTEEEVVFGDINSDGLIDAYYLVGGVNVYLLEHDPTQPVESSQYYHFAHSITLDVEDFDLGTVFPEPQSREEVGPLRRDAILVNGGVGDFNSDGKVDFIVALEESQTYFEEDGEFGGESTTYGRAGLAIATQGVNNKLELLDIFEGLGGSGLRFRDENYFRVIDLNQDGYSDLLYLDSRNDDNGTWRAYLNDGKNLNHVTDLVTFTDRMVDKSVQLTDINNDGYSDFVWKDFEGRRLRTKYWLPDQNNFSTQRNIPRYNQDLTSVDYIYSESNTQPYTNAVSPVVNHFITSDDDRDSYVFGNFDSVGGVDLLHFDASESRLYIIPNRQLESPSHVVNKITNGLGAQTIVNYSPINETDHYSSSDAAITSSTTSREVCYYTEVGGDYDDVCYTQTLTRQNTDDFYSKLNTPYQNQLDTVGADKSAPVLEQNMGLFVVTDVSSSAPTATNPNAMATISYHYEEAKLQAAGRGSLGFKMLATLDLQTGVETRTTYVQEYPYIGSPEKTETSFNGQLIKKSVSEWNTKSFNRADGIRYQPFIEKAVETSYQVTSNFQDGFSISPTVVSNVETFNQYDNYGNVTYSVVKTTGDGNTYTVTSNHEYGNSSNIQAKILGRLSSTTVINARSDNTDPPIARTSKFNYYGFGCSGPANMYGLLCSQTVFDGSDYELTTTYEYDSFGNKIKSISSASGLPSRVVSNTYESHGRYMDRSINHYNQVTQDTISRNTYGNPTEVRDILGTATQYKYTPLGEQYLEYAETGGYSVTYRKAPTGICPVGTAYQTETRAPDNARTFECVNKVGQSILQGTQLLNGDWTYTRSEYDTLGRMTRQSEPHKPDETIHWTSYTYDVLGNVIRMDQPNFAGNSRISYMDFDGLIKVDTNVLGQKRTETKNALGELIQIKDNLNTTVTYQYNDIGDLRFAKTTAGSTTHTVETRFDNYSHKTHTIDPDKGTWTYEYNAFNELTKQTNANGDERTLEYDQLGRQISRVEPDGTSQWVYNNTNSGNSRGQMDYEVLFDSSGNIPYQMNYTYDGFGRVSEMTTNIDGEEFTERTTYDVYGRTFQSFDAAMVQNTIQYQYKNGHMYKVVSAADTSETYYQANKMDARGNVTEYIQRAVTTTRAYDEATGFLTSVESNIAGTFGTQDLSYSWDALANLKSRTEKSGNKNLTENFTFDEINRLSSSQVVGRTKQNYHYDAFGNTTFKTGVGNYKYGSGCVNGAGPHAVCEITNGTTTETFDYDNNGNMLTHRVNGAVDRQFVYSSFDKPTRITKDDHTTEFEYGSNRSRYKRTDTSNGETTTTLYIGSVEILNKPDGNREIRRYINGTVLVTQDYNRDSNGDYQFARAVKRNILTDHLGSTDVITDVNGQIVQEQSFDAWGARRATSDGVRLDDIALVSLADVNNEFTTKGFTGHEAVDQVGVIHMNGRIYDARLGRFLQADPQIDGVTHTQGFNRYAYGKNNPLNGTDPSGYGFLDSIKQFAGAIVGIALTVIFPPAGPWAAAAYGAISGAVGAAVNGGNILQGALVGGLSAAAFSSVSGFIGGSGDFFGSGLSQGAFFGRVAAHGFIGGVQSVLQGGKFGHGFASAGFTQAFAGQINGLKTKFARVSASAVVGGTASEISGGKFVNGAATVAFNAAITTAIETAVSSNASTSESESNSGIKYGGQEAYDEAIEALSTIEGLSDVAGNEKNYEYNDVHVVSKKINGRNVYRTLGGAEIDNSIEAEFNRFNKENGGGWSINLGSCAKGHVCSINRGATASSIPYGKLSRVGNYPQNYTKSSVESALAVFAHEYVHYRTGQPHPLVKTRISEFNFGRAEESAVNLYRGR
ncbi:RHS repeat-associated core domain-containing protein [Sessilibacter corallicola]|uniref:Teneurin-like YD-shell domain-containing protein n=1 Tax=Sessilibacter corallicola TaxID=2904075 RepID=A0ABQ0A4S6_9GAMM